MQDGRRHHTSLQKEGENNQIIMKNNMYIDRGHQLLLVEMRTEIRGPVDKQLFGFGS